MSESNQRDPSTQYLMYKAALKSNDTSLGRWSEYSAENPSKVNIEKLESALKVFVTFPRGATRCFTPVF